MIVSGDKDFIQLQKYDNVKQYSPITKKLVDGVDPKVYIKEHVLKGTIRVMVYQMYCHQTTLLQMS